MILQLRPQSFEQKSNIAYWDDFLSDQDINFLLALPEWKNAKDAEVVSNTESGFSVVDKKIRKTDVAWLPKDERTSFIYERIAAVVEAVNATYFKFDLTGFYEPAQLGVYKETDNGFYSWHVDGNGGEVGKPPRKLSMALMLDDPATFEGGDLMVKTNSDDPITLEQKRGRAWFFPSYILHTVTPVTKGVRRSLVLWVGGPEFK